MEKYNSSKNVRNRGNPRTEGNPKRLRERNFLKQNLRQGRNSHLENSEYVVLKGMQIISVFEK